VLLGGEISRVDLDLSAGGYRAVVLGTAEDNWSTELRWPLLQRAASSRYERPEGAISVGVQRLDGTDLQVHRFKSTEMDTAERDARSLARRLRSLGRSTGLT
jgi:hypothetical protein